MADAANTSRVAGLRDVTGWPAWYLKGATAETWLQDRGLEVPSTVYSATRTADGARITRTGIDEFLIESTGGDLHQVHQALSSQHNEPGKLFILARQDALLLLTGDRAGEVMAQTCGINWSEIPAEHLVMTRVAGVSCSVRPVVQDDSPCFAIRFDPTYRVYLWQELSTICRELGGTAGE